jgi:hypothetical protein
MAHKFESFGVRTDEDIVLFRICKLCGHTQLRTMTYGDTMQFQQWRTASNNEEESIKECHFLKRDEEESTREYEIEYRNINYKYNQEEPK